MVGSLNSKLIYISRKSDVLIRWGMLPCFWKTWMACTVWTNVEGVHGAIQVCVLGSVSSFRCYQRYHSEKVDWWWFSGCLPHECSSSSKLLTEEDCFLISYRPFERPLLLCHAKNIENIFSYLFGFVQWKCLVPLLPVSIVGGKEKLSELVLAPVRWRKPLGRRTASLLSGGAKILANFFSSPQNMSPFFYDKTKYISLVKKKPKLWSFALFGYEVYEI